MPKFDYEVIAARHANGDHSRIISYKVKHHTGGWGSPLISEMDRMDIIIYLGANIKIGVRENPSDNDLIPVILVNFNGHYYIKTIANNVPEDNLGNLPEF